MIKKPGMNHSIHTSVVRSQISSLKVNKIVNKPVLKNKTEQHVKHNQAKNKAKPHGSHIDILA